MFSNATITVADPEDPSSPISRFCSLIEGTDQLRSTGFDVAILESCENELCQRITDGMETELISPPRVADYIRSNYNNVFSETLKTGNLNIRLNDDLPPFGVSILDNLITIIGYDPEGVTVRVLVDTDSTDAREWAELVFTSHRRKTPTIPIEKDN